jgi:sulfur carrier protein ThiS adenylyltransferase
VNARIGIAGAGGLGSNVAVHLARAGVENILLVDFDVVEPSNLNRQFYFADQIGQPKAHALVENLKRIRPLAPVEGRVLKLDPHNIRETFAGCVLVVEAFDRAEAKAMLVEALLGTGVPLVAGSGVAGLDVSGVKKMQFGRMLTIIGDQISDCSDHLLYSAKVGMVSAWMAVEVLTMLGYRDA